jgi:hypothetical protein
MERERKRPEREEKMKNQVILTIAWSAGEADGAWNASLGGSRGQGVRVRGWLPLLLSSQQDRVRRALDTGNDTRLSVRVDRDYSSESPATVAACKRTPSLPDEDCF